MSSLLEQYASSGQASMLHLMMLAGVDPNLRGRDGKTLAHHAALYAVATGDAAVIRKIADYGGSMLAKDATGVRPLDILRARPELYSEISTAVLSGVGNAGLKDSNVVSGKSPVTEKNRLNRRTIKKLRGEGRVARPLNRPRSGREGGDSGAGERSPSPSGKEDAIVLPRRSGTG